MKNSLINMQNALYDRGVRGNYTSEENLHLTLAFSSLAGVKSMQPFLRLSVPLWATEVKLYRQGGHTHEIRRTN